MLLDAHFLVTPSFLKSRYDVVFVFIYRRVVKKDFLEVVLSENKRE